MQTDAACSSLQTAAMCQRFRQAGCIAISAGVSTCAHIGSQQPRGSRPQRMRRRHGSSRGRSRRRRLAGAAAAAGAGAAANHRPRAAAAAEAAITKEMTTITVNQSEALSTGEICALYYVTRRDFGSPHFVQEAGLISCRRLDSSDVALPHGQPRNTSWRCCDGNAPTYTPLPPGWRLACALGGRRTPGLWQRRRPRACWTCCACWAPTPQWGAVEIRRCTALRLFSARRGRCEQSPVIAGTCRCSCSRRSVEAARVLLQSHQPGPCGSFSRRRKAARITHCIASGLRHSMQRRGLWRVRRMTFHVAVQVLVTLLNAAVLALAAEPYSRRVRAELFMMRHSGGLRAVLPQKLVRCTSLRKS